MPGKSLVWSVTVSKRHNIIKLSDIGNLLRSQRAESILSRIDEVVIRISEEAGLNIAEKGMIKDHPNITLWAKDYTKLFPGI